MSRKKCAYILLTLLVSIQWGCGSRKQLSGKESSESRRQTDSVSLYIKETTKAVTISASESSLVVPLDSLEKLPAGASYSGKNGQASVLVEKKAEGTLRITASCDSLLLLVTDLQTELYHTTEQYNELKKQEREEKTAYIQEPTSFQWFQIWMGRLSMGFLMITIVYKRVKRKIKII